MFKDPKTVISNGARSLPTERAAGERLEIELIDEALELLDRANQREDLLVGSLTLASESINPGSTRLDRVEARLNLIESNQRAEASNALLKTVAEIFASNHLDRAGKEILGPVLEEFLDSAR